MKNIDWGSVYSNFDGNMPECLGKDCSKSCCQSKKTKTWGGPDISFNTRFEDRKEYELFKKEESEGKFKTRLCDIGMDRSEYALMIQDCLDENGCHLKEKKPLQCRTFPFRFSKAQPLDTRCPQAKEIALNIETVEKIKNTMDAFGFPKEDITFWQEQLEKRLKSL